MDSAPARRTAFALLLVLSIATRFWGLGWGLPNTYHIDENWFAGKAIRFTMGDLNPHFFQVGTLHMYVVAGLWKAYYWTEKLAGRVATPKQFYDFYIRHPTPFYLLGRTLSALLGAGTVLLLFFLGLRMFNLRVGLAAGLFLTFSPEHVKSSHAMLPDVPTVFFLVLAFTLIWMVYKTGRRRYYIGVGVAAGVAMAMKYAGHMMAIPLLVAHLFRVLENGLPKRRLVLDLSLILCGAAFVLTFLAGCPYALLDFARFKTDFGWQSSHLFSAGHFGSSVAQPAWLFYLQYGFRDNVGPWAQYLGFTGVILALARRKAREWILLSYPLVMFLLIGMWQTRATRYFLHLAPFFILLAAVAADGAAEAAAARLRAWLGKSRLAPRAAALLFTLLVLVAAAPSAVRVVRYDDAIARPDTRTLAKDWVHFNIPAGAAVAIEMYDPPISRERYDTTYRHSLSDVSLAWLYRHDIEYVIVSDINYARFTRYPKEFPGRARIYFDLEKEATLLKSFSPAYDEDLLDLHNPTIKVYRLTRAPYPAFPGHFERLAVDINLVHDVGNRWVLEGTMAGVPRPGTGERVLSPYIRLVDAEGREIGRTVLREGEVPAGVETRAADTLVLPDPPNGARIVLGYSYDLSPNPLRVPPEQPFFKETVLPDRVDEAALRGGRYQAFYRFGGPPGAPAGSRVQSVTVSCREKTAILSGRLDGADLAYGESRIEAPWVELRPAEGETAGRLILDEGGVGLFKGGRPTPVEKRMVLPALQGVYRVMAGDKGSSAKNGPATGPASFELLPPIVIR